ncbi:PilZ domain-containing protein [Desulfobacula phenolica]|uniref:PilZ domain-containing protein n=1 Tax=Desulfobacula phenolica TaxID=90732 RepID=A0A1H2DUX4_9BACT|nr:PilZ domain-containing protein [Desulfobacula phenolica]SDT86604.1 PilZ domain-containing protein [Desulfobacula phenolica]
MERNRRFEVRKNINIPILYAKGIDDSYHKALLYNISMNGMNFVSDKMFLNGEYFFIKIKDSSPGFESLKPYDACTAQVIWCVKTDADFSYKVGVKRIGKAKIVKKEAVEKSHLCCELCANSSIQEIVKTDESLCLCLNCFTFVSKLPCKALKKTFNRFMLGNVI